MGISRPTITIDITAAAGKAKAEIDRLHGSLQGKFSKISKISNGVKLALAGAGAGAVALAKSAVTSAGNLEQTIGAVDAVFKTNAGQMHAWARGASTAVGLTRNEFNELGVLIGTQLKNGGTAMDDLAPKTNNLIKLGADLSSMFGGSTRDAVEALSSALKGERDPIERYGVSLTQAKIDAEAAALGFQKVGGSLSTEATQAATLSLIMKQTADAHGNFSRETNTLAHKQQVLQAKMENIKSTIGMALLPMVTKIADVILTKAVPSIEQWASKAGQMLGPALTQIGTFIATVLVPAITSIIPTLGLVLTALSPIIQMLAQTVLPVLNSVASTLTAHPPLLYAVVAPLALLGAAWMSYTKFIKLAEVATKAYAVAQKVLNLAMKANPIGLVITAITALVAVIVYAWNNCETFRNIIISVWDAIKKATVAVWTAIKEFLLGIWKAIKAVFEFYLTVYKTIWEACWSVVKKIFTTVWNGIKIAGEAIWKAIKQFFTAWLNSLKAFWQKIWTGIKTIFVSVWNNIKKVFTTTLTLMKSLVTSTMNKIRNIFLTVWKAVDKIVSSAWNSIVNSVKSGIEHVVKWISGLGGRIFKAIGNLGNLLLAPGKALLGGFLRGIEQGWKLVKNKVSGFAGWIAAHKGPISYDQILLEPAGKAIMNGLMNGIESQRGALKKQLKNLSLDIAENTFIASGFELGSLSSANVKHAVLPEIHISVNALTPTAEVGRVVATALNDYWEINGRGREL